MKIKILILLTVILTPLMIVQHAAAATASVYFSPSSKSVTKGTNVTLTVRVSSGSNMDAAQTTLSWDSSKLQYASHSGGNFTTVVQNVSSSSFEYAGAAFSPLSGDKSLFSITFKTVGTGTATISQSGTQIAYSGAPLTTSKGSATVSISAPASGSTGGTGSGGTIQKTPTGGGSTATVDEGDKTAPSIKGKPEFIKEQSTITVKFESDEDAAVVLTYSTKGKDAKTLEFPEFVTKHEVAIGQDSPLSPGTTYDIQIKLKDKDGNESAAYKYSERSKGVTYRVKIVDTAGKILANHKVTLHSDPIETTTDENGVALFEDVTPGEHTLMFDVDGVAVQKPVQVGSDINLSLASASDVEPKVITLPFQLSSAVDAPAANNSTKWILLALAMFFAGMAFIKLPFRKLVLIIKKVPIMSKGTKKTKQSKVDR